MSIVWQEILFTIILTLQVPHVWQSWHQQMWQQKEPNCAKLWGHIFTNIIGQNHSSSSFQSRSQKLVQVLIAASNGDRMALERWKHQDHDHDFSAFLLLINCKILQPSFFIDTRAHLADLDMNATDYDGRTKETIWNSIWWYNYWFLCN